MRGLAFCVAGLMVATLAAPVRGGSPEFAEARPIAAAAANHLDVVYLPERLAGGWEDRWVKLNVHVPPGDGPFPCIVFVHGGGYAGGDKDGRYNGAGGPNRELLTRALKEGYVAVNLNYILKGPSQDGITPQVYADYKAAIRFLRAHADKFRIDRCRMAGWGFSAGGWLSGSGTFTTADDHQEMPPTDVSWGERRKRRNHMLVPLDELTPTYPEKSARINAVVADFWPKRHYRFYSADDPAILTYVGKNATHALITTGKNAGNESRQIVLTNPKFAGKASLHGPPLDGACRKLDGDGESVLVDEVFAWLKNKLVNSPRLVPPEARPNQRIFADSTRVSLVACSSEVAVYYTTDGSEPTHQSPRYTEPFTITESTTVKAIAVGEGFADSAVGMFKFVKGDPPPTISGPAKLPDATVGRPYEVAIETPGDGPVIWNLAGHAMPNVKMHKDLVSPPLGLMLDERGVLSGTPTRAGLFTIQVQAARGAKKPATYRTWVLRIKDKPTAETEAKP